MVWPAVGTYCGWRAAGGDFSAANAGKGRGPLTKGLGRAVAVAATKLRQTREKRRRWRLALATPPADEFLHVMQAEERCCMAGKR